MPNVIKLINSQLQTNQIFLCTEGQLMRQFSIFLFIYASYHIQYRITHCPYKIEHNIEMPQTTKPLSIPPTHLFSKIFDEKQNKFRQLKNQKKINSYFFQNIYRMNKYNMSNYPELIHRIFTTSSQSQTQSLRKLIYLAVNHHQQFLQYVPLLIQRLPNTLTSIEDDENKLLALQLLSEMAANYPQIIPAKCYCFAQLIELLSDENVQIRKASHYLILIFIKKYQQIDSIIEAYLQRINNYPEHHKILQKIIHSFQSLLIIQPKCIKYTTNYPTLSNFINFLLLTRHHQHSLVQKASQQTVSSLIKNEYINDVLPQLDEQINKQLSQFAQKMNIPLHHKKKSPHKQSHIHIQPKLKDDSYDDIEEIHLPPDKKINELESFIAKLNNQSDWKIKLLAIEEISKQLATGQAQITEQLIEKVLNLAYDYNFKTCITAMNTLLTIVTLYPNTIINKYRQIQTVIIDKICDLKMAVRQISNKILRIIHKTHSKDFLKILISKLNNCSIVGKQQILNFFQQIAPKSLITGNLTLILHQIANQIYNQNTKIKIKSIDCLVKICSTNNIEECKYILNQKLNQVYYDMFQERLKNKIQGNSCEDKEQFIVFGQKSKGKKGMTWQAPERTLEQPEKQAMTNTQFGSKKKLNETQQDIVFANLDYQHKQKQRTVTTTTATNKTSKTNTSSTFKTASQAFQITDEQLNKQNNKKIPIKPTPIIKKLPLLQIQKEQSPLLAIHSKEYKIKKLSNNIITQQSHEPLFRNIEKYSEDRRQSLDLKPKMKITKNRNQSCTKSKDQKSGNKEIEKTNLVPLQPFSIKKSTQVTDSLTQNKQHIIDYKAAHYTTKDDLCPLDNPKQTIKYILQNLPNDKDWNKQFTSLDYLRRLIKNHEDFYPSLTLHLSVLMPQLLKLVESLRSSVSKNAMITLSEMCQSLKKVMDVYLQSIFIKLFKKTQDTNIFISEQVKKCITSLCRYCTISKICSIISSNSNSKSLPIKMNIGLCIKQILEKKKFDVEVLKQNSKIINVMNGMVIDASLELRNMMKEIFGRIIKNNDNLQIQALFKRNSSKDCWQKWKTVIGKQMNFQQK